MKQITAVVVFVVGIGVTIYVGVFTFAIGGLDRMQNAMTSSQHTLGLIQFLLADAATLALALVTFLFTAIIWSGHKFTTSTNPQRRSSQRKSSKKKVSNRDVERNWETHQRLGF